MIKFRYPQIEHMHIVADALLPEHITSLESYIQSNKEEQLQQAGTAGFDKQTEIRDSSVMWIPPDDQSVYDVYDRIVTTMLRVNMQVYNFNLDHLEVLQYAEYGVGGHFTWHVDGNIKSEDNNARKLSFSLLLSDDFEGGDLEFFYDSEPKNVSLKKNDMIFFPSTTLHRVTPVTKGVRKSLVGWVHGPDFV